MRWRLNQVSPGVYTFVNKNRGRNLDVYGARTADGTDVIMWDSNGGKNQQWTVTATDSGFYRISPGSNLNSGLDVSGWSTAEGGNIQEWTYLNGSNQQWSIVPAN